MRRTSINQMKRMKMAIELRNSGLTYPELAIRMDVSDSRAKQIYCDAIRLYFEENKLINPVIDWWDTQIHETETQVR